MSICIEQELCNRFLYTLQVIDNDCEYNCRSRTEAPYMKPGDSRGLVSI